MGPNKSRAYEVVDWLRLMGPSLSTSDLARLLGSLERLHKPALAEFCQYLDPREIALWKGAGLPGDYPRIANEYVLFLCLDVCHRSDDGEQSDFRDAVHALYA